MNLLPLSQEDVRPFFARASFSFFPLTLDTEQVGRFPTGRSLIARMGTSNCTYVLITCAMMCSSLISHTHTIPRDQIRISIVQMYPMCLALFFFSPLLLLPQKKHRTHNHETRTKDSDQVINPTFSQHNKQTHNTQQNQHSFSLTNHDIEHHELRS